MCAFTHAQQRFWERYKIKLTKPLIFYIKKCIMTGKTLLDEQQLDYPNRSVHVITLCGKTVPVVYDNKYGKIITCLPSICNLNWNKIK
jgi:hypothetical protein